MSNWKIVVLIGTIIFLISGFLSLVSLSLFDFSFYFSLFDVYTLLAQGGSSSSGEITVTACLILKPSSTRKKSTEV